MTDGMLAAVEALRKREEAGQQVMCPRCGINRLKPELYTNALSRHLDGIYVCDECGLSEALLDFKNAVMPTEAWAVFQEDIPPSDFKDKPGAEVWEQIRMEHGPVSLRLFKRWRENPDTSTTMSYNLEARKLCPGLRQLWTAPFQAVYDVADGELVLRVREAPDGVEIVCNLLDNDDDEMEW